MNLYAYKNVASKYIKPKRIIGKWTNLQSESKIFQTFLSDTHIPSK